MGMRCVQARQREMNGCEKRKLFSQPFISRWRACTAGENADTDPSGPGCQGSLRLILAPGKVAGHIDIHVPKTAGLLANERAPMRDILSNLTPKCLGQLAIPWRASREASEVLQCQLRASQKHRA